MPNKRSHKSGRRKRSGGGKFTDALNNWFSSKPSTDATAAENPVASADAPPEEDEGIFASIIKKIKSLAAPPSIPPPPATLPSTQQPIATNPMQQPSAANTMVQQPQGVGQGLGLGQGQGGLGQDVGATTTQGSKPFANPGGGSKRNTKTHKKHNHKTHKKHKTHNKRSRK